jgi:NAD(P)-dependent dehydrogenase (short-subunit alcohol dehydrogenase family)
LKIILFGATGQIGSVINKRLSENFEIIQISSKKIITSANAEAEILNQVKNKNSIDGVIWSQGINQNDSILDFKLSQFEAMMDANLKFILNTIKAILDLELLKNPSSLVIISSIWQEFAKKNKLSYSISKAALSALVKSLALDLSERNIRVNSILPGVVDNEMTRQNLSQDEILKITDRTPGRKLISSLNIADTAHFLLDQKSQGINGQSIFVDNGWSINRD